MTLMELLVALVIGTFIMTLIVQGLGLGLGLFERVTRISSTLDVAVREANWWHDSTASLVGCIAPEHCLEGNGKSFEGYSFAGVQTPPGTRVWMRWELSADANRSILTAFEGRPVSPLVSRLTIDLPADARFAYRRADGSWVNRWDGASDGAPAALFNEQEPKRPLPTAIRIEDNSGNVFAFARPTQRRIGPADARAEGF